MSKQKKKSESEKKSNAGRPTDITFETQEKICHCLKIGSSMEAAAAYADISKATLYNWLKAGKEKKGKKFEEFLDAVNKARDFSEIYHLNKIDEHSKQFWAASKWILENRFPKRFGPKSIQKIEGEDDEKSSFSEKSLNEIIAEELDKLEDDRFED